MCRAAPDFPRASHDDFVVFSYYFISFFIKSRVDSIRALAWFCIIFLNIPLGFSSKLELTVFVFSHRPHLYREVAFQASSRKLHWLAVTPHLIGGAVWSGAICKHPFHRRE